MSPRPEPPTPSAAERREEMDARVRRLRRAGIAGTLAAVGVFSGLAAAGHSGSGSTATTTGGSSSTPATDGQSTQSVDPTQYDDPYSTEDDGSGTYFSSPSSGSVGPSSSGGVIQGSSGGS
jgi:hypothetical protein